MDGVGSLVEQATSLLERVSQELEPELLDGDGSVRIFESLARVVKLAEASQARRCAHCRRRPGRCARRRTRTASAAISASARPEECGIAWPATGWCVGASRSPPTSAPGS